jgi:hypothetical protein
MKEPPKTLEINQTTRVYVDNEAREPIHDKRQIHKKASVGDILKLEQKKELEESGNGHGKA